MLKGREEKILRGVKMNWEILEVLELFNKDEGKRIFVGKFEENLWKTFK